jgi:hypothetical protein
LTGVTWSEIPVECVGFRADNWRFNLDLDLEGVGYHPPYTALKGSGKRIIAWCHYNVEMWPVPEAFIIDQDKALLARAYPNGYQEAVSRDIGIIEN